jgi:hypothetical protein
MSTEDQGEGMITPTPYKYSIKYQPTAEGVRVHMTGHGDDLTALGNELAGYYPTYLETLEKTKGVHIAPLEKQPKFYAVKSKDKITATEEIKQ